MPIPSSMADLSTTAASNSPAGTDSPTSGDDYLRSIQAIIRSTNAKGADIASASSIDIGAATGEFVDVTGTTTITALGTVAAGIVRTVRFTGALTLTHNATSLILPGSANITTANGDIAQFRSLGSGNWKCTNYIPQAGYPLKTGATFTGAINEAQGADIASAGTVNLTTATGNYVHITGTTTITAITLAQGYERTVVFDGALTLTNGASLLLPGSANITTAAGDTAVFRGESAGVVRCVSYIRKDGTAVAGSALSYLTAAEYITGTDTTKILNASIARSNNIVSATKVASTSGTSIDFTSIPSWVKRITIMLSGVSTNGTSDIQIQLGDSGGIENTGYLGSGSTIVAVVATALATSGFVINSNAGDGATSVRHGTLTLTLLDSATNTWSCFGIVSRSDSARSGVVSGSKATSAALDRVRITTVNGTDTFDAGSINILYE